VATIAPNDNGMMTITGQIRGRGGVGGANG
jgi:hypothetical protein